MVLPMSLIYMINNRSPNLSPNFSYYRRISVLPVVSRRFKKLIYDYLDSNKLIFGKQSAYRQLHSVHLEGGKYTAVTFVDLKKAFGTVNHEILLQKLELYGILIKEMKWFCSCLTNRR